jgi:hypothetical protein
MDTCYLEKTRRSKFNLVFSAFPHVLVPLGLMVALVVTMFGLIAAQALWSPLWLLLWLPFLVLLFALEFWRNYLNLIEVQKMRLELADKELIYFGPDKEEKHISLPKIVFIGIWIPYDLKTWIQMSFYDGEDKEMLSCTPFDWSVDDCQEFIQKIGVESGMRRPLSFLSEFEKLQQMTQKLNQQTSA